MNKPRIYILICIVPVVLLFSCSTQKNTWITRTYHGITSKYNVFFNGNESFKEGVRKVEKANKDDYVRILSLFKYGDATSAKAISGDMDRAIKKASKIISLHSIKVKPEIKSGVLTTKDKAYYERTEFNPWVDNSYMLLGKSYFYKQDYKLALETFKYLVKNFSTEPSHYEAMIWLARTNIEMKDPGEAQKMLELLDNDVVLPGKMISDFQLTYCNFLLKKEDYLNAIIRLQKAMKGVKKKENRTRYTYILAQLYAKTGNNDKASILYEKVIKMNPPYEMLFNARINRAGTFVNGQNSETIKKELYKLLKDEKNKEYRDQIYYALANIEFKETHIPEALELYKKSAQVSMSNTRQKVYSFKTLGDIYYNMPDYIHSQANYDSAMVFLDDDFPEADIVKLRAKNLTALVINLNTITLEDSVQLLAKMDEKSLLVLIDKEIEKVRQKELEARQKETEQLLAQQFDQNFSQDNIINQQAGNASGAWYFYNQSAKTYGETEFRRKWGTRKLEDNWRRINKKTVNPSEPTEMLAQDEIQVKTAGPKLVVDNKSRDFYLQYIPRTDSAVAVSHIRIKDALYNAGIIYEDNLKEPDLAMQEFRTLITRYPDNNHLLSTYYQMYLIADRKNDKVNAEIYKNLIIARFPDSHYANLLSNPNYMAELEQRQNKVFRVYDKIYGNYNANLLDEVITDATAAADSFSEHPMKAKFLYIRALAIAKKGNIPLFREQLNKLIESYPKGDEADAARNFIAYLDNQHPEIKEVQEEKKAEELYVFNADTAHIFTIVLPKTSNINQLMFNIINYNLDHFPNNKLNVSQDVLGKESLLVTISPFANLKEAFGYFSQITASSDLFNDVNAPSHETFIITPANLKIMVAKQAAEHYLLFFRKNYLSQ